MMKNNDIAENVLQWGKEGVRQNMAEALNEFCEAYADEMWKLGEEVIKLRAENAALRDRLNITKMALEYSCLESVQGNEKFLDELKEKVNKYIKQAEDVVYGQKNGVTFRFAEARLAELKGGVVE